MANATIVYFDGIWNKYNWDTDKTTHVFRMVEPWTDDMFDVDAFENGIATISTPNPAVTEIVAGCFDEHSNFASELLKAFDCDEDATFTGIKFDLNGVTIMVTKENADIEEMYRMMYAEKRRIKMEAYMKTPEYRAKRAKALKIAKRRETVQKDVIAVDASTEFLFKDEEVAKNWEEFVENNSRNDYSKGIVTYACRWAKYMQYLMEKHNKTVAQVATQASHVSNIEGLSATMYECAMSVLVQCWKYGEELRKWYNKEYGKEW